MPFWNAGKINRKFLEKRNINPLAFEYIETFLFSTKYIKESSFFYMPNFSEFVYGRGEVFLEKKASGYRSPVENSLHLAIIELENILEKGTSRRMKELYKFYKAWYVEEVDNAELQKIFGFGARWMAHKRDLLRVEMVVLTEHRTLLVPKEFFYLWILPEEEQKEEALRRC